MILWSVVALFAVLLSGVFSGMETGVYSLERVRIQVAAARGDARSSRLLRLVQDPARAICTLLLANNAVNYLTAAAGGHLVRGFAGPGHSDIELELLNTLWVVPVLFVFGELVPKSLFLRYPASLASRCWPIYAVFATTLKPLVNPIVSVVRRLDPSNATVGPMWERASLAAMLREGDEGARLHDTQRRMATRVLALRQIRVRERMVPRQKVTSVPHGADHRAVVARAATSGRSRVLIEDSSGQSFAGYVRALDAVLAEPGSWAPGDRLFSLPKVDANQPILDVLRVLQAAHRPLAQVMEGERAVGLIGQADIVAALLEGS